MRSGLLLFAILSAGLARGQEVAAPVNAPDAGDLLSGLAPAEYSGPRVWGSAEYLLWWCKPVCLKPGTLSIGNPADAAPGAAGQPGTQVVLGEHKFEFSGLSGMRATLGMWLSDDDSLGWESTGFLLEQGRASESFRTINGGPSTYIPFTAPNGEDQALPFSVPGSVNGTSQGVGRSWLWGAETNLFTGITAERGRFFIRADLLAGVRYLDLRDKVDLANRLELVNDPGTWAVGAANFTTHNQFYGGQMGARFNFERGNWSLLYAGKLALGETHQVREVTGSPLLASSGNNSLLPGPVLAEPSNVGRQVSSRITVIPEAQFKLRYRWSERLGISLGYSALYWNKVLCPGDQMDGRLNVTQLPGRGPETGARFPAPLFVQTDYFAQGFDLGIEFRY